LVNIRGGAVLSSSAGWEAHKEWGKGGENLGRGGGKGEKGIPAVSKSVKGGKGAPPCLPTGGIEWKEDWKKKEEKTLVILRKRN